MKVQAMLAAKGGKTVTIRPDSTIETAANLLKLERIGALVVSEDGEHVAGILSERDIVRGLVDKGVGLLEAKVADLMTSEVKSCSPDDSIQEIMSEMTRSRIRHLPVLKGGKLIGIISIGDVVKNRLEELQTETNVLRDYIVGRS